MSRKSTLVREAALLLLVVAAPAALAWRGIAAPTSLTLKLGPNDGGYTESFRTGYEIDGDLVTRWSSDRGGLRLPFVARAATLHIRYRLARMLAQEAIVDVVVARRLVDRFRCRGGVWLERTVEVAGLTGPLDLDIYVNGGDERDLGVRMDRVRVDVTSGRLRPRGLAAFGPLLLCAGAYLLLRLAPLGAGLAVGLAALPGLVILGTATRDPFLAVHLGSKLWAPALGVTLVAVVVGRGRPGGSWLAPIVLAGYLAKGVLVFHPAFFYLDVQNHGRYVRAMAKAEGGLVARGIASQVKVGTAYPRIVAGQAYAFPYSPVYFVPFLLWADEPGPVENALRHAGLITAALAPVAVFLLASALGVPALGLAAAGACAAAPPYVSRLLLAMWPTLAGHVLDVLAILAALLYLRRPEPRRLAWLAAATLAALLTYITGLLNLGAFLFFLALLNRERWREIGAVLVGSSALTVALLYADFTRAFVTEIVPALLSGTRAAADAVPDEPRGLLVTLGRIPIFYGWFFPVVAAAGLLQLGRQADLPARRVVGAWALALGTLILLRGLLPGLFGDLKEMTYAAPLFAVGVGTVLATLWGRGRLGRTAAVVLSLALIGLCVHRSALFFRTYQPVYMQLPADVSDDE